MERTLANLSHEIETIGNALSTIAYNSYFDEGIGDTSDFLFMASNYLNRISEDLEELEAWDFEEDTYLAGL